MFVLAADGAILDHLQLPAEAIDIGLVHLVQGGGDIGGGRGIAAQLLQRYQDLVGAALGAVQVHLLGLGRRAVGADEVLVQAGVEAADVAQHPGDVGVIGLPVGIAVELGHLAHLLVEQGRHRGVEHGVVGDDLPGGILARLGGAVDGLVHGVAQGSEFHVQCVDAAADGGAVVKRGKILADRVHPVARAIGRLAIFFDKLGSHLRGHHGGPVQDVGGEATLGIHVARDFTDCPHHRQPALRNRHPVHGLVFRDGHIDGETAAHGRQRDDGRGQERADFHGMRAIHDGSGSGPRS